MTNNKTRVLEEDSSTSKPGTLILRTSPQQELAEPEPTTSLEYPDGISEEMLEDLAGDFAIGDEALSSEFPGDLDDASFPDELAEGDEEFLKREDLHSPDPESTPSKEATISMAFQSQETSSVRERRERVRQSRKREKSPFSLILGASALVVGLTLLAIHLA